MDSFLGGATGFGAGVPSYGDIGTRYSGDFFGAAGPNQQSIGSSILGGLGRGLLGGLSGSQPGATSASSRLGPYTNQAQNDMQNLLALAFRSFETPRSTI